jgi:hypothetical protein
MIDLIIAYYVGKAAGRREAQNPPPQPAPLTKEQKQRDDRILIVCLLLIPIGAVLGFLLFSTD